MTTHQKCLSDGAVTSSAVSEQWSVTGFDRCLSNTPATVCYRSLSGGAVTFIQQWLSGGTVTILYRCLSDGIVTIV